jgi:hypothetical protein
MSLTERCELIVCVIDDVWLRSRRTAVSGTVSTASLRCAPEPAPFRRSTARTTRPGALPPGCVQVRPERLEVVLGRRRMAGAHVSGGRNRNGAGAR